jgi:hypothetical protein
LDAYPVIGFVVVEASSLQERGGEMLRSRRLEEEW